MTMIEDIKKASASSNAAQRNWDHSVSIPQKDVDCLVQTVLNAPTKQNETHYKVFYTTDKDLIYKIYYKTKHFAVADDTTYTDNDGKTLKEYNVRNSQVNANLLFAFCDDWNQNNSRAKIHAIVDERSDARPGALIEREKQRHYSIGVAAGELILAANLLGYKTGLCSAFWSDEMKGFFHGSKLQLLVGVGVPHPDKDRTEHEETYNKDIILPSVRSGSDNEKWKFPSFKKEMSIKRI